RGGDGDLARARGTASTSQDPVAEGAAVMELRAVEGAAGITVGVQVNQPDRLLLADRLQDRMGHRVVAADRQRRDARLHDLADMALDVLDALLQPVAAAKGDVADIGNRKFLNRRTL